MKSTLRLEDAGPQEADADGVVELVAVRWSTPRPVTLASKRSRSARPNRLRCVQKASSAERRRSSTASRRSRSCAAGRPRRGSIMSSAPSGAISSASSMRIERNTPSRPSRSSAARTRSGSKLRALRQVGHVGDEARIDPARCRRTIVAVVGGCGRDRASRSDVEQRRSAWSAITVALGLAGLGVAQPAPAFDRRRGGRGDHAGVGRARRAGRLPRQAALGVGRRGADWRRRRVDDHGLAELEARAGRDADRARGPPSGSRAVERQIRRPRARRAGC